MPYLWIWMASITAVSKASCGQIAFLHPSAEHALRVSRNGGAIFLLIFFLTHPIDRLVNVCWHGPSFFMPAGI
jgi:hypothetical protein